MLKKIAAAALVAGSLGLASPAMAQTLCVDFFVDVNGTQQTVNVCTPV